MAAINIILDQHTHGAGPLDITGDSLATLQLETWKQGVDLKDWCFAKGATGVLSAACHECCENFHIVKWDEYGVVTKSCLCFSHEQFV